MLSHNEGILASIDKSLVDAAKAYRKFDYLRLPKSVKLQVNFHHLRMRKSTIS